MTAQSRYADEILNSSDAIKPMDNMYSAVCDTCPQVLTEDVHIFIWEKGEEEKTICSNCNDDLYHELKADGWKVDQDDMEEI